MSLDRHPILKPHHVYSFSARFPSPSALYGNIKAKVNSFRMLSNASKQDKVNEPTSGEQSEPTSGEQQQKPVDNCDEMDYEHDYDKRYQYLQNKKNSSKSTVNGSSQVDDDSIKQQQNVEKKPKKSNFFSMGAFSRKSKVDLTDNKSKICTMLYRRNESSRAESTTTEEKNYDTDAEFLENFINERAHDHSGASANMNETMHENAGTTTSPKNSSTLSAANKELLDKSKWKVVSSPSDEWPSCWNEVQNFLKLDPGYNKFKRDKARRERKAMHAKRQLEEKNMQDQKTNICDSEILKVDNKSSTVTLVACEANDCTLTPTKQLNEIQTAENVSAREQQQTAYESRSQCNSTSFSIANQRKRLPGQSVSSTAFNKNCHHPGIVQFLDNYDQKSKHQASDANASECLNDEANAVGNHSRFKKTLSSNGAAKVYYEKPRSSNQALISNVEVNKSSLLNASSEGSAKHATKSFINKHKFAKYYCPDESAAAAATQGQTSMPTSNKQKPNMDIDERKAKDIPQKSCANMQIYLSSDESSFSERDEQQDEHCSTVRNRKVFVETAVVHHSQSFMDEIKVKDAKSISSVISMPSTISLPESLKAVDNQHKVLHGELHATSTLTNLNSSESIKQQYTKINLNEISDFRSVLYKYRDACLTDTSMHLKGMRSCRNIENILKTIHNKHLTSICNSIDIATGTSKMQHSAANKSELIEETIQNLRIVEEDLKNKEEYSMSLKAEITVRENEIEHLNNLINENKKKYELEIQKKCRKAENTIKSVMLKCERILNGNMETNLTISEEDEEEEEVEKQRFAVKKKKNTAKDNIFSLLETIMVLKRKKDKLEEDLELSEITAAFYYQKTVEMEDLLDKAEYKNAEYLAVFNAELLRLYEREKQRALERELEIQAKEKEEIAESYETDRSSIRLLKADKREKYSQQLIKRLKKLNKMEKRVAKLQKKLMVCQHQLNISLIKSMQHQCANETLLREKEECKSLFLHLLSLNHKNFHKQSRKLLKFFRDVAADNENPESETNYVPSIANERQEAPKPKNRSLSPILDKVFSNEHKRRFGVGLAPGEDFPE